MVIITEVKSLFDLVQEATFFAARLQAGWYKGSAEVDAFRDKVRILSGKHAQWSNQVRKHGISEDEHLLPAVRAACTILDKQQRYVRRLERNPIFRLRKKVFPGELSNSLDQVLQIVDAGPQLLAERVSTHDLLERVVAQTPTPLHFSHDLKYVPISETIVEVQEALEDPQGPRVVTVCGGPGQGKSSLVKYLALQYEEENKQQVNGLTSPKSPCFPDGVYYLFCGQGARDRVKDLQQELLTYLGFGASSVGPQNDSTAAAVQGEYTQLVLSPQMKLRSCLAEQRVLIVLDDLWEREVLEQLLVHGKGVKYLTTSQNREIWGDARNIQLKDPTMSQARNIMANYTHGLSTKGRFPDNFQNVTDRIIENLHYHPLSLANVGISVNSSRAEARSHWETISRNFHVFLENNDFHGSPSIYDRPYNLSVGASMILMVESLLQDARPLLFLIALLGEPQLPETLVKFFYKFTQTSSDFIWKYHIHEKYLEDRSLVGLETRGSESILVTHGLRMYYIREMKSHDVRNVGSQILAASSSQGSARLIQSGNADETLLSILGAVYFKKPFTDIVANTLENHFRIINDGLVIPRTINTDVVVEDLLNTAPGRRHGFLQLVTLLNPDDGEADWKFRAHSYAKKIIIKLVCQGKLDDHSMARLLQIPQATSAACAGLGAYHSWHDFYYHNITFSSVHEETMTTLLALLHDNATSTRRRADIIGPLFSVLAYETEDTIFSVAAKCREFLAMDANPTLQIATTSAFVSIPPSRGTIIISQFPGIVEILWELLTSRKDEEVRCSAGRAISLLCTCDCTALRISLIPNALQILFNLFLSEETQTVQTVAGNILGKISIVPDNRIKFREVESLESLGDILGKLKEVWQATLNAEERFNVVERASVAAGILGEVALAKELKEIIVVLPGIEEGLLFLQLIEMDRKATFIARYGGTWNAPIISTRVLTILYSNFADARFRDLPPFDNVLRVFSWDEGSALKAMAEVNFSVYWTRVLAYLELGAYGEALANLDLAEDHLHQISIPDEGPGGTYVRASTSWDLWRGGTWKPAKAEIRNVRIFLQAMLEDYQAALLEANARVEECLYPGLYFDYLAERGVLKRLSGDLQGSLEDFNVAFEQITSEYRDYSDIELYNFLKHRGYVKYLMEDEVGAKEDAEYAKQCRLKWIIFLQEYYCTENLWKLQELPVNYLGFTL